MGKIIVKSPIDNKIHSINSVKFGSLNTNWQLKTQKQINYVFNFDEHVTALIYRVHSNHIGASISSTVPLTNSATIYKGDSLLIKFTYDAGYIINTFDLQCIYTNFNSESTQFDTTTHYTSILLTNIQSDLNCTITTKILESFTHTYTYLLNIPNIIGNYEIGKIFYLPNMANSTLTFNYSTQLSHKTGLVIHSSTLENTLVSDTFTSRVFYNQTGTVFSQKNYYHDRIFTISIEPIANTSYATIFLNILDCSSDYTSTSGTTNYNKLIVCTASVQVTQFSQSN